MSLLKLKLAKLRIAHMRNTGQRLADMNSLFLNPESDFTGKHFLSPEGLISKRTSFHTNQLSDHGLSDDVRPFLKKTGSVRVKASPEYFDIEAHNPLTEKQLRVISGHIKKNRINPSDSVNVDDFTMDNSVGRQLKNIFPEFQQGILPDDLKLKAYDPPRRIAKLKTKLAGISQVGTSPHVSINPRHGKIIADAYENMKHDPNHPAVKAAYGALINETKSQFTDLINKGLKIDKIKEGTNPYPTSREMHNDVEKNNHLFYFPTDEGYGAAEQSKNHPMLSPTEFNHEGKPLLANDVFRIVHDINGHNSGGRSGFGPKGEHQAYLTHKKMYSSLANKALFSETAGQNNYVNFGPNAENNRKNPKNTIYAEQKAGIIPENIINGNYHTGAGV